MTDAVDRLAAVILEHWYATPLFADDPLCTCGHPWDSTDERELSVQYAVHVAKEALTGGHVLGLPLTEDEMNRLALVMEDALLKAEVHDALAALARTQGGGT